MTSDKRSRPLIIFLIIFIITLCGFIVYKAFVENNILPLFVDPNDKLDVGYYSKIFHYLDYPFICTLIIIGLIITFRYKLYPVFISLFKNDKLIYWILGFIIIIQALTAFLIPNKPFSDSVYYIDLADRLIDAGSYANSNGNLTAFWPVGYPLYLAGIKYLSGDGLMAVKLFNIFFSAGLVLSLHLLLKPVLSKTQLNLFVLLFCLYPGFLVNSNVLMPEYIAAFILWICVYLITKKPYNKAYLVLAGALLSFGTLIRPAFVLLPLFFLLMIYLQKDRAGKRFAYVIFAISFLSVISPWLIRNYNVYDAAPVIATNGGYNFLMGNHSSSDGKINFEFEYDIDNPDEVSEQSKAYSKGLESIVKDPFNALIRSVKKIFFSYYRGDSTITWIFKGESDRYNPVLLSSIFFISNYYHWMILIISLMGFRKFFIFIKEKKMIYLAGLLIYFLAMIIIYVGNERYIIPVLPVHLISAVLFLRAENASK